MKVTIALVVTGVLSFCTGLIAYYTTREDGEEMGDFSGFTIVGGAILVAIAMIRSLFALWEWALV